MTGDIIRRFRLEQGLTLRQLAEQAGVTDSYLSLLETNGEEPSLSVLRKLAKVFGRPVTAFFEEPFPEPSIIRASERKSGSLGDSGFSWVILTPEDLEIVKEQYELLAKDMKGDARITLVETRLAPGIVLRSGGMPEQACIYLRKGAVRIQLPDTDYLMRAGDSLYLQPFVSFTAACEGSEPGSAVTALSGTALPSVTAERSSL